MPLAVAVMAAIDTVTTAAVMTSRTAVRGNERRTAAGVAADPEIAAAQGEASGRLTLAEPVTRGRGEEAIVLTRRRA
ncbi:hypothetical protein Mame01_65120 [Microbispora amethystogenes]|nr:hypothetical protein Mame01_65120 [Microbispora amethystogenes]